MSAEIIAELRERADRWDADTYDECWEVKETPIGKSLRAAALRLDELERENAALREALFETHLDLVAYADIDVARKRLVKRRAALAGSGEK